LNPDIIFAALTAKVVVSRIYKGVVLLALLSSVFIYASYLTRYFLHDKLLENVLHVLHLHIFGDLRAWASSAVSDENETPLKLKVVIRVFRQNRKLK
jgi:hypothetical protein